MKRPPLQVPIALCVGSGIAVQLKARDARLIGMGFAVVNGWLLGPVVRGA
jgi:hypothetical protein